MSVPTKARRILLPLSLAKQFGEHAADHMRRGHGPAPVRPGRRAQPFDWPSYPIGQVGSYTLLVADELGAVGDAVAHAILAMLPDALAKLSGWFDLPLPAGNVIIAPLSDQHDGSGGAYHAACESNDLYVDCCSTDNGERSSALAIAEASEVLQAAQRSGWDCGQSHGEGLSRLHAEIAFPHALDDYNSFSTWLDGERENWIDEPEDTDSNYDSTGCSVGFLFWLMTAHGETVEDITRAGAGDLAQVWNNLGLTGSAWTAFRDACEASWPSGRPSGVTVDNPDFGGGQPPPPPPPDGVVTISLSAPLAAGSYDLTPSGQQPQRNAELPPEVVGTVKDLLAQGVPVQAVVSFLRSALSLLPGLDRKRGAPRPGTDPATGRQRA